MTTVVPCDTKELLASLLTEQKEQLCHFFDALDTTSIHALLTHLASSSGTLFLSGVGKSGAVAKKIAATMNASGTKALYLSPLNALHGDIGMVAAHDTVLLIGKSGESEELLNLCPALRNRGAYLVAVVCHANSRLAKAADQVVVLPVEKELCPFDMVPTTSTVVQLLFGDLLAIALMQLKGFTVDDFRRNHPAGRLGKRLLLTVKDVMISGPAVPSILPDEALINALPEFSGKKCGCLLVVDSDAELLGIFTDGDLRRALQKYGATVLHKTLKELMVPTTRYVDPKTLAFEAMKIMEENQKSPISVLPVVEEGKVVGLLRMHDIVQSGIS